MARNEDRCEWVGVLLLFALLWMPWTSVIRWAKEEVKKPNRSDVI